MAKLDFSLGSWLLRKISMKANRMIIKIRWKSLNLAYPLVPDIVSMIRSVPG